MFNNLCLIGNPNCGKTTLFNAITGSYQRVGNFTGVTVESKEGAYKKNKSIKVIDLPGLYSLSADSVDEKVVLRYLKGNHADAIINVVDGTNLERNLFLTCELCKLNIPMVIAVNMCDDLDKNDIVFNDENLSKMLGGVKVVRISALKNINVDLLMETAITNAVTPKNIELSSILNQNDKPKIFNFIESNISKIITKKQTKAETFTQKADNILTHRVWGIPIFVCVIVLTYYISSGIGGYFGGLIEKYVDASSRNISRFLLQNNVASPLVSFFTNAIIQGVGTVLSFLPQILTLFTLLTVIEESGYASRVAFILDRVFRSFGLGGKSMLPIIVSCGCSVTGIMATRVIENESERRMTIFLSPIMPCGAKTVVFGWFAGVLFGGNPLVSASIYFLSIICVVVFGKILVKLKAFSRSGGMFLLEIPTLRFPSIKDIFYVLKEKVKDFILKAGTVIFAVSIVVWLLKNFGFNGYTNGNIEGSFAYVLGNLFKYIFYPLGFGNWQATVSVFSSVLAKEAVIETLAIFESDVTTLFENGFSAFAFMAFILLAPPCVSALGVAKRELKSNKWFAFMLIFQTVTAYLVALIINVIGKICLGSINLLLSLIIGIIVVVLCVAVVKLSKKSKCINCKKCFGSEVECKKKLKRNTTI